MKKVIAISMLVIILFALVISEVMAKPIDYPSPPIWAHTPGAHPTQHKTKQPTITPTVTQEPKPTGQPCDDCMTKKPQDEFLRTPMIHRPAW